MRILINTSNLYFGGGVQVAVSFIKELVTLKEQHLYTLLISPVIKQQLLEISFPKNFHFRLIKDSPSSLLNRISVVKQLNSVEEEASPDIVFTVFGPSYWRPKSIHISGFADGWVYNQDSIAYNKLPFFKRLKMRLRVQYKLFYLKKTTDYFILETKDAANKLSKILTKKYDDFFVVGNTYSDIFNDELYIQNDYKNYIHLNNNINEFKLMYVAHNHPAKNLSILNEVIPYLKKYNIRFVLTIDNKSYNRMFSNREIREKIQNLGAIDLSACPSVYNQCDALFAPTLLETFSAAYPEAMKMQKPILTSDFSFARTICKDAALYFNPIDPRDIAQKIISLIEDKNLQKKLIQNGISAVQEFETANSRAKKYIMICNRLVKGINV